MGETMLFTCANDLFDYLYDDCSIEEREETKRKIIKEDGTLHNALMQHAGVTFKQGPKYYYSENFEEIKTKWFTAYNCDEMLKLESKVNKFIKDKKVISIQFSQSIVMIVYK